MVLNVSTVQLLQVLHHVAQLLQLLHQALVQLLQVLPKTSPACAYSMWGLCTYGPNAYDYPMLLLKKLFELFAFIAFHALV